MTQELKALGERRHCRQRACFLLGVRGIGQTVDLADEKETVETERLGNLGSRR